MAISIDTLRLYIVEHHLLFAKAIAQALSASPGIAVAGCATLYEEDALAAAAPDVILIDVDVDDCESLLQSVRAVQPDAKICVLSMQARPELMNRFLLSGADGYILKDCSPSELLSAIRTIAAGSTYVDPRVAGMLLRRRLPAQLPYANQLSPRETDIIRLIAQGLSNRDIGQRLVLSEKTVKNHVSRIFSKLHFTARSQAAVHAIRNGLA